MYTVCLITAVVTLSAHTAITYESTQNIMDRAQPFCLFLFLALERSITVVIETGLLTVVSKHRAKFRTWNATRLSTESIEIEPCSASRLSLLKQNVFLPWKT